MENSPKFTLKALLLVIWLGGFLVIAVWRNLSLWEKQRKLNSILGEKSPQEFVNVAPSATSCQVQGALPDLNCTPGAIFNDVTIEKICVPGYSKSVRSVSSELRRRLYEQYQISYPQPRGSYEADHLIPLALGGSNDLANLWPEAAAPVPGFKEKDVVEIYLHDEVCAGRVDLTNAQQQIAENWLSIYLNLNLDAIKAIKAKYRNWSN